ncbi:RNA 2'-phosphotransferase [Salinigranum rubrum]|uniref:Probable RNA 2'-phosphotransferase n=1 Tax=Salinigranum rubrum TaxID=755307 RepID=A0A2I8VPB6_9EURY|nr:RNA 2'-phosphotransferase [Salinigranum rubrum]AUV83724.1 RNA 2'-phosphotransferase [Salinigranum rubrum]
MPAPVSTCSDHGTYFEAACPVCGDSGHLVLSGARRKRLSTFVSGALRHFPDDVGFSLDAAGWTPYSSVVASVTSRYDWAGEREVEAVLATDPKGRFETRVVDGERELRAAYGHSVDVDLDAAGDDRTDADHPDTLYHGTAPRNLDAILAEGLKPMGRQAVHLSGTRETARDVGRRHTDGDDNPVVLAVDVRSLVGDGFAVRKRGTGTYTVARVPPEFLSRDADE